MERGIDAYKETTKIPSLLENRKYLIQIFYLKLLIIMISKCKQTKKKQHVIYNNNNPVHLSEIFSFQYLVDSHN